MYIPRLFKEEDQEEILRFIRLNSFSTLISTQDSIPIGTHIPLHLAEKGDRLLLTGHIAKPNPMASALNGQDQLLAIFHGPHTYISSSWYDHVNVPTWNYQAIHVYGRANKLGEKESVKSLLDLVKTYESDIPDGLDWENLPEEVVSSLKGIIAFEIEVEKIEAKSKLSQNRKDNDYFNIIEKLKRRGPQANDIAEEMKKRREKKH